MGFELGRNRLAVSERSSDDRRVITERLAEVAQSLDLAEPFTRIREAIEEAHAGGAMTIEYVGSGSGDRHCACTCPKGTCEPVAAHHWVAPPAPPDVAHVDLRLQTVSTLVTGWNRALSRPVAVEISTIAIGNSPPRAIKVPIRRSAVRVRTFQFHEPIEPATSFRSRWRVCGRRRPRAGDGRRVARNPRQFHADPTAQRRDQARRPVALLVAASLGNAAVRPVAKHAVSAVSLPVRGNCLPVSAACGNPGR